MEGLVGPAVPVLRRAFESKAAEAWRVVGWPGTEVPDAHKTFGEQVQQEAAPPELIKKKSHQLLFVVVSRVLPAEGDLPVSKRDQAMVGDGHTMGVAA
jgi:hypothetical protein